MTVTRKLEVREFHVKSEVQCRFATTQVHSLVHNVSDSAEQTEFVANLPEAAFITYFEMEVDGKVIVGDVKEKEEAKQRYENAKSQGETAGHIAQAARETNTFNISVNVAAYSSVRFKLAYQELLQRVRGVYKHQINIHPGQIVEDLQVNVNIKENAPITILHVPTFAPQLGDKSNKELLSTKAASDVQVTKVNEGEMCVSWKPSVEDQKMKYSKEQMTEGQLIVLYDVDRRSDSVLVVNGHFIHFFAPKNFSIGPKNIVFAIDISGSMAGHKLQQTKEAMQSILAKLNPTDHFNILCFDTSLETWKPKSVEASAKHIDEAFAFVQGQHARGGTDIDLAVQTGLKWLKDGKSEKHLASVLVLLTDGQHNSGGHETHDITPRALKLRKPANIKIYGLGFGDDADFDLLKKLSAKTGGFARKIYVAADAAAQLDNFYNEISSPLLADLKIQYLNPELKIDKVVYNQEGDTLFEGSEWVMIGQMEELSLKEGQEMFSWAARTTQGPTALTCCYRPWNNQVSTTNKSEMSILVGDFIERSWAYLTTKNLLEKAKVDALESENLQKKALEMALKYKFVTELTSMVVTKDTQIEQQHASDPSVENQIHIANQIDIDIANASLNNLISKGFSSAKLRCKKAPRAASFRNLSESASATRRSSPFACKLPLLWVLGSAYATGCMCDFWRPDF